MSDEDIAS